MSSIKVLKVSIAMPNTHFRVIHSNNPCKTYPLPPYSTAIGFLANILGDKDIIHEMLKESFALGILSNYEYITQEYTWLRNIEASSHRSRFCSNTNRKWQGVPEHPGKQSPVVIEVLNQVQVYIFLYHPNKQILQKLEQNIVSPEKWFSHLHLGRSEDWAVIESAGLTELSVSNAIEVFKNAGKFFQWMPDPKHTFGINDLISHSEYGELYEKIQGNAVLVTSTYKLKEVLKNNRPIIIRNFDHIPARLCCFPVPFLNNFTLPALLTDTQMGTPVYMALINNEKGAC